jgi:hypothetical protein
MYTYQINFIPLTAAQATTAGYELRCAICEADFAITYEKKFIAPST